MARILFSFSSSSITIISLYTFILIAITVIKLTEPKHHHRFSCLTTPKVDHCPIHKHKICGSDGKLYPSRCHLKRASCDRDTIIRPAHPDQCIKDEGNIKKNLNDNDGFNNNNDDDGDGNMVINHNQDINNNMIMFDDSMMTPVHDFESDDNTINENTNNNNNNNNNVPLSSMIEETTVSIPAIKLGRSRQKSQKKKQKQLTRKSSMMVNGDDDNDRRQQQDGIHHRTLSSLPSSSSSLSLLKGNKKNRESPIPAKQSSLSSSVVSSTPTASQRSDEDGEEEQDECRPKQYDLMKEKVLDKINDVSLLFTRLDENNDGKITLNELWKHSMIYKSSDSFCLLTDLMQHEDLNGDDKLDYSEFQAAFNKLFSVTMVTLDESLAVNKVDAHLGDNVEIRCDIQGEPEKPAVKWFRHGVDLSTLNLPYIKVFSDSSLYLTDLKLSFAGNYSCQAVNNPTVKQTHIVHVIVDPTVEVSPRFQWSPIGGVASFECRFETFDDDYSIHWFKNDEQLIDNSGSGEKVILLNNGTLLQVSGLEQTDTGAYTCRINHLNGASGQSLASLLVQDESVESAASESRPQRLWIFHANGLTIYEGICGQPIHEIDARDTIYQNSLTLCGNNNNNGGQALFTCDWSEDVVHLNGLIYIGQPSLNRILVLHDAQLSVIQVIATDPRPRRLWTVETDGKEPQIWVLCDNNLNYFDEQLSMMSNDNSESGWREQFWSNVGFDYSSDSSPKYDSTNEKYLKNRKTIQVIRLMDQGQAIKESNFSPSAMRHPSTDVVHLQPVDGHFDLVYDLFVPNHYESIFKTEPYQRVKSFMRDSPYVYATHWEERSLIKISTSKLQYFNSVRLVDCQPITASIISRRAGGLVAVQCQTPVTHQLNGQLILDQVTDAILVHNSHLNAHRSYLSPDHRYLVSILHEFGNMTSHSLCQDKNDCYSGEQTKHSRYHSPSSSSSSTSSMVNTSTIIVQKINNYGIEFMYDVRTSLDIVNCLFVWKNGVYDLVLASGTPNREDLLYLSLIDGHVELISGIGRPTDGHHRRLALSNKNRVLSISATESVYTIDLMTNRILCESNKHFQKPQAMIWTA